MLAYAIEKRGSDFIVKADQQDILKFATKRQAIQMIRHARTGDAHEAVVPVQKAQRT